MTPSCTPRRIRRLAVTATLAAVTVGGQAACAGEGAPAPRVGEVAPPYTAETLEGDSVTLASFRGRPILVNLWATWCAPCREETPFLQSLYEEHRDTGFDVVGISMDTRDQKEAVGEFVEEYGVTYTILWDPRMRGMDSYRVMGLPATFLLDREGVIRWMQYGPVAETSSAFLAAVDSVVAP